MIVGNLKNNPKKIIDYMRKDTYKNNCIIF
jgi:hypothetical protein